MPYIKQDEVYDKLFSSANEIDPKNAGELNFVITEIIQNYFYDHGNKYQQINDVMGALEGAKLEFYRRLVAGYEDEKIRQNGDVY